MTKHAHQPEPPEVEDREAVRRCEALLKAREEREAVRRERGHVAIRSGHGMPFSWEERTIVHRLAAENPADSARMLAGRFLAETHRGINHQTVRDILDESPPPGSTGPASRPRGVYRYTPRVGPYRPPEPPVEVQDIPPVEDADAAIEEIAAILKWLPPADRARVRAWFATSEVEANFGSNA